MNQQQSVSQEQVIIQSFLGQIQKLHIDILTLQLENKKLKDELQHTRQETEKVMSNEPQTYLDVQNSKKKQPE